MKKEPRALNVGVLGNKLRGACVIVSFTYGNIPHVDFLETSEGDSILHDILVERKPLIRLKVGIIVTEFDRLETWGQSTEQLSPRLQ